MPYKKRSKTSTNRRKQPTNAIDSDHKQRKAASLRRKIKALMHNECFICGYHTCLRALELHHVVSSKKRFNISMNILRYKWETIVHECCKCVLLCNRCHTEVEDGITELAKQDVPDEYYIKLKETLKPAKTRYKSKSYAAAAASRKKTRKYSRKSKKR